MADLPLSIIVPTTGREEPLLSLLRSIQANRLSVKDIVLVVSHQLSPAIRGLTGLPLVVLERRPFTGFAQAVNHGITAAEGDSLMVVNDDCTLSEDFLSHARPLLSKHPVLQPCILDMANPECIASFGSSWSAYGMAVDLMRGRSADERFRAPMYVFGITGTCFIARKEVFQQAGLFDRDLGSFLEDVDLSFRLLYNRINVHAVPNLVCYHQGGASFGRLGRQKARHSVSNVCLVQVKNIPASLLLRCLPKILYAYVRMVVFLLVKGHVTALFLGWWDVVRKLKKTWKKRRIILSRSPKPLPDLRQLWLQRSPFRY